MTGPTPRDPRFTSWLSQQAPSGAPHDLLERTMLEIEATVQAPMHRRRLVVASLSLASVAAVAVALAFLASRPSPLPVVEPPPSGHLPTDIRSPGLPTGSPAPTPEPAKVLARIPLPNPDSQTASSDQIAVSGSTIWTAGSRAQHLLQVDARQNRIVSQTDVPPSGLMTSDTGRVWTISPVGVAPGPPSVDVSLIDPATGIPHVVAEVPQGPGVAVGLGRIWVLDPGGLSARDAKTGKLIDTLADVHAIGVSVGCGSLWVWQLPGTGWQLERLDPESGMVLDSFHLPDGVEQRLVEIGGMCWTDDGVNIYGVAPGQSLIETEVQPAGRVHLASDSAWVLYGNTVRRVDPVTGRAIGHAWRLPERDVRIEVPKVGPDWHLLSADGSLWLLRNAELIRYAIPTT